MLHVVYEVCVAQRQCTRLAAYSWVKPGVSQEAARQALVDIVVDSAAEASFVYLDSWYAVLLVATASHSSLTLPTGS